MLIGSDHADFHSSEQEVAGEHGEPVAKLAKLGWTCIGSAVRPGEVQSSVVHYSRTFYTGLDTEMQVLDRQLQRFWEIDSAGTKSDLVELISTPDERAALEVAQESLKWENGRYEIALPWKREVGTMPNNRAMAEKRLQHTERRLKKQPEVAAAYSKTLKEYLDNGYVSQVQDSQEVGSWYLPHFAVVRMDRSTTKVRIVFDAAAKYEGVALNDALLPGPKLQRDLFDVLLRFRAKPVAVMCDIREMYMQVSVKPSDRQPLKFLWRDLQEQEPEVFQFNRLVFGLNVSPFLAQFVVQEHARRHMKSHPLGADAILHSTYMDDTMDSASGVETAVKLYQELEELWSSAGMKARKWLSNSSQVLEGIPADDRAKEIELSDSTLPTLKTLGVLWSAEKDHFSFSFNTPEESEKLTKRMFLKKIATVFDPLGLIAPFIVQGKMIMQDLWAAELDWDDAVSSSIGTAIKKWFRELPKLDSVAVPENPADLVSRGSSVVHLNESQVWWEGPSFLRTDESQWPELQLPLQKSQAVLDRTRKQAEASVFVSVASDFNSSDWRLAPERFSSFTQLKRIMALVSRFVSNCRGETRRSGHLSVAELNEAEVLLVSIAQCQAFGAEFQCINQKKPLPNKSSLLKLNPKIDTDGLL